MRHLAACLDQPYEVFAAGAGPRFESIRIDPPNFEPLFGVPTLQPDTGA